MNRTTFPRWTALALAVSLLAACNSGSTTADAVNDTQVTERVKAALGQSEVLKGMDIAVVTQKGDVRLTAEVETQAQIDEALRLTRAATGVHTVQDELSLKK